MTLQRLAHLAKLTGIADRLLIDDWPELKRFAEAVAELATLEEREACAKVCEDLDWSQESTWQAATLDCAAAIRERGTR